MNPADYGKTAVLMGGTSRERKISLQTGAAVLSALQGLGVNAQPVDPANGLFSQIARGNFDRAFIALHGRGGEDGSIQGALTYLGVPYTGSGVMAAALSMDKIRSKQLWRGIGLPTPDFMILDPESSRAAVERNLGLPLMVKPALEGSSIGMSKVEDWSQFEAAQKLAFAHDKQVFAERWVDGSEYTVAIVGDLVLPAIRLETPRQFYDYQAKYESTETRYFCPCGLAAEAEGALQDLAMSAFRSLGCEGWGRVDLMLDQDQRAWLVEVNTVPGLTDHSLVPMAAKNYGWSFSDLVVRILDGSRLGRPALLYGNRV